MDMESRSLSGLALRKSRGLTGLANTGNSCYLNACIQVLSHTHELNEFLDAAAYKGRLNKKADAVLLLEWDALRRMMWESDCTIAPHGFVGAVRKVAAVKGRHLFAGQDQSDAQEFMLFLTECFHGALARPVDMRVIGRAECAKDELAKRCYEMMRRMYRDEYSEMLGMFYGIHVSRVNGAADGRLLSTSPEPFSVVSLSLAKQGGGIIRSVEEGFAEYCRKETMSGAEKYETGEGELVDATRQILFWSLPSVLMIDLKRWGPRGNKLQVPIDIPLDALDLSNYVVGYGADKYIYELYAVCNHHGSSGGGHYTAGVRVTDGRWYEFNDTRVTDGAVSRLVGPQSYCLFYRKKK